MKKKKNVLLYTRPLVPPWDEASKNLAFDIAKKTVSNEIKFHLLTSSDFANKLKNNPNIVCHKIFDESTFDQKSKLKLLGKLFKLKKNEVDLIHFLFTPRPLTSGMIRLALSRIKPRTIQTIATLKEDYFENPRQLKRILFADKIIVQSNWTKRRIQKHNFKNIEVIYPGIDFKKYQHQEKDKILMKKLGIKEGDFIVLYAGEYSRLKAIDDLIQAIDLVFQKKEFTDKIKFLLAVRLKNEKDVKKKTAIIEKINEKDYNKNVIFLDTVEDMAKLYNLSDIQVFPVQEMSGKFDIPLVLVESMACKKPVIASDIEVLKEFIKNEETGLITPKGNPSELAKNILRIKKDKKLYQKISKQGLLFSKKNFDIKNTTKKYSELYLNP